MQTGNNSYTIPATIYLLLVCQSSGGKSQAFSNYFANPIKRIQNAKDLPTLVFKVKYLSFKNLLEKYICVNTLKNFQLILMLI